MSMRFSCLGAVAAGLVGFAVAQVIPPPPQIAKPAPAQVGAAAPSQPAADYSVSHYDLNLNFNFPTHQLEVTAKLTLTPRVEITGANFRLNRNLQVKDVTDASGTTLGVARQQDQVVVTFPAPLMPTTPVELTFHYAGVLADANLSPISGIRTAYVGPDGAFLLYPGEWFPVVGYGTDRFTAAVTATLPASMALIGSGTATSTPGENGEITYHVEETRASFPGSVIVTPLKAQSFNQGGLATSFYFSPDTPSDLTQKYAAAAADIYTFLTNALGTPPTTTLQFVELPTDAMPSFSSPDLIVLSRGSIGTDVNTNLMVDELAQQWWGVMLSPATLNDAWLQYGAARFCESLYIEHAQGQEAWKELVQELEVGALSYPDTSLSNSDTLYVFSPQFQDLNYDKGAMLFHMLRWELGDQPFNNALRNFVNTHAWQSVSTQQFEQSLEKDTKNDLRSFFSQWYTGTEVPAFSNQYTTYRLQSGGFRVTGKIQQNLDLFNMPVEVAVSTDGATQSQTVPVSGSDSDFTIDISGRPNKVTVDPDNWILKSSPELNLQVDLSRGDNLVAAGDFPEAIKQYQAALVLNPISSLAHYRMAEAYYQQQNWQSAADSYRQAINGDLNPKWIEVWSHIQLGKIFDLTGQRDRALNEYQLALATNDDTNGARETAQQYLKTPYKQ